MTTLEALAAYVPDGRIAIEDVGARLGLTPMQVRVFKRYHGLAELGWEPDKTLLELLRGATSRLEYLRGRERRVRYVLYARAFGVVEPYPCNTLHELCQELGLAHALTFAVTHQSCATGLLALDLAGTLLAADPEPDALALVIAGEKAFTTEAQLLPDTSIFGEGSSACVVKRSGSHDRLLTSVTRQRGDFDGDQADVAVRFQREYPDLLAEVILAAADRAAVRLDDLALIVPHNVNLVSWQRLCRRLEFPISRVLLDNITTAGHVFCADAFLNLRTALDRGLLQAGDRYLVAAAGAGRGATFSAMVFEH